jgi:hypothetical protein
MAVERQFRKFYINRLLMVAGTWLLLIGSPYDSVAAESELGVEGDLIRVETDTYSATLDCGVIVSLVRKADGTELVRASAEESRAVWLVYSGGEAVPLGGETGDRFATRRLNRYQAEIRIESWNGDAVVSVSVDPESGDLIIQPGGYASRPGLRACRWQVPGIAPGLELVAPFFQGARMPFEDDLVRDSRWEWPHYWEAGLVMVQGGKGGFWVHCRDDRYIYKGLQVGNPDDPRCLGFDTEVFGPIDNKRSAGGLAWRLNLYEGDWRVPAALYRDWLEESYHLKGVHRPAWVDELGLALSWCPSNPAILDALAERIEPKRVLLHIPYWRSDPYDENYPTYVASDEGAKFIEKAKSMGFHAMPHFNAIDMDPVNPAYDYLRDFQYRHIESKRVQGWTWDSGQVRPVPESNTARLRHRDKKTMVKIHPGLSMWRSILTENVQAAVESLSLDVVFLDVTLCSWNLHNSLVENTTSTEGMKRIIARVGSLGNGLVVGGEGRNEITMQDQAVAQVHLFKSWQGNIDGLERVQPLPLNEFLFGKWCRSFGYSKLSGRTSAEALRMKMHIDQEAVPTITIRSPEEIKNPNPAVEEVLAAAGAK